jgi:hypothetical protein
MVRRESGRSESFWLWTGDAEYDGRLVAAGEDRLIARVRFADRGSPSTGAPGMPVPFDLSERQRWLTRRIGFGQSPAIHDGALLQFRVTALQPSSDPFFVYVLAGSFTPVADEHLEPLSRLSSNEAFRYLQSCSPAAPLSGRLRSG